MKVLILCAHRPRRSPSQRYRFEQYLTYLEGKGFSFCFSPLLNKRDDAVFYAPGHVPAKLRILMKSVWIRVCDVLRYRQFDVVFIQREASFLGTSFFEWCAYRSGRRVVFDFDDSIWLADTSPGNKKWEWVKRPSKFFNNLRYAHTVVAGNAYLAEQARRVNSNTLIIPTTIDTDWHVPNYRLRGSDTLCIGWSGSVSTIKHFETLNPVLLQLKEKYGTRVRFKLVGDATYRHALLPIESVAWTEEGEVDAINTFDIGLMPLPDDEWARGKCGLKALSYMACGVPVVASPVGVNRDIVQQGVNGYLAGDADSWLTALSALIENPDLREQLGVAGRQTVVERYSVLAHRAHYLNLFEHGTPTQP